MWDYKDHLSETVWVSLRPITAFSAVACVQSLINVKKYWKNCIILYADREGRLFTTEQNWIIIMQTLEHDTTRLWGKQLKIVHFDIWCRLEVGCSEMPVLLQTEWCFCIYIQMLPIEQLRVYLLVNNHWKMMFWSFCSATVVPEVGLKLSSVCVWMCNISTDWGHYGKIFQNLQEAVLFWGWSFLFA